MEPYEVKFGVDIWEEGVYERFVRYVLAVEKLGFDSIWGAEAHDFDLLVKLTVAAVKTTNVKLGTVVLVPALRYPAVLAKTLASLDIVSGGRLILGVGCSDQPSIRRRGVPSDKPASRMLES
ncbi:MAG: LLM class flavin-dependent oxidoreductase, partial [Candidatus Bathyarchaeota archaeon]|nr:LLM class flavin-dependent oxidoreductase [Candidatus Bathyarchaeota archaeon]